MRHPSPRQAIFPAVVIASCLLLIVSRSVYGSSSRVEGDQADTLTPSATTDGINPRFPQSIQHWREEIHLAAAQNQIDPDLVAAVILQESAGQPGVISSSGAVGLMQVMPHDGIAASFMCVNGPCFRNRPSLRELKDPFFNISYGTRLLAQLISREGSIRAALRSYGPMDVGFYYADQVLALYDSYQ